MRPGSSAKGDRPRWSLPRPSGISELKVCCDRRVVGHREPLIESERLAAHELRRRGQGPGRKEVVGLVGDLRVCPVGARANVGTVVALRALAAFEPLDHTGALYFAITIFSTVGFGDITPKTDLARIVASVQMLLDLVLLGTLVRLLVTAARSGLSGGQGLSGPSL